MTVKSSYSLQVIEFQTFRFPYSVHKRNVACTGSICLGQKKLWEQITGIN